MHIQSLLVDFMARAAFLVYDLLFDLCITGVLECYVL